MNQLGRASVERGTNILMYSERRLETESDTSSFGTLCRAVGVPRVAGSAKTASEPILSEKDKSSAEQKGDNS